MITLLLLSLFLLFLTKRGGQGPLGPSPSAGVVQTFIHSSPAESFLTTYSHEFFYLLPYILVNFLYVYRALHEC